MDLVERAVAAADGGDGVVLIVDIGSSVLTATMLIEDADRDDVLLADAPMVEGRSPPRPWPRRARTSPPCTPPPSPPGTTARPAERRPWRAAGVGPPRRFGATCRTPAAARPAPPGGCPRPPGSRVWPASPPRRPGTPASAGCRSSATGPGLPAGSPSARRAARPP
ncbi:PTS-dependent dihydroxyacetone kinase phosphotransferase subunit DhaM [Actinomadura madurae]|uniref:PTS-dependent dihydroxyacetone kinase phosphotransferase subunit DhaM n=1 Tax=Actinomadura madurae TaxID=1993 RepID=UPI0020D2128B|nr:hypothetical protein [Actinomadura madurae]MCQ0018582.1 hypothetical protein [Actinomadura madurae]